MTTMKLYAAGGAGCNLGSAILKSLKGVASFTEIDAAFIDTSRSNINPNIPTDKLYLFDSLDGSGKLRASNYDVLNQHSREILLQHKPADINIILSSGGGGSGSVIAPILTSELLSRGEYVIVITVGSTASRIETENTLKTIQSYEVISQKRARPVVMAYRENTAERPRSYVDKEIGELVLMLAIMFSGNNHELDMSDLRNFLSYHKTTSFQPKLSYLSTVSGSSLKLEKGEALISLVTLTDGQVSSDPGVMAEYQAVGFIPEAVREFTGDKLPIHAAILSGYYNGVVERLEGKIKAYDSVRSAVIEKSVIGRGVDSTDDGLVL